MGWWLNWRLHRLHKARNARVARLKLAQVGSEQDAIKRHRKAIAYYTRRIKRLAGEPEPASRLQLNKFRVEARWTFHLLG